MNALANFFTRIVSRYMPDPLVVAILLTALTVIFAMLAQGSGFLEVTQYWGDGFWNLLSFTMQMTIILLAGYILARTPLVDRLMNMVVGGIHSPRAAIIVATLCGGVGSWLNWGFGLVLGTLIAQKLGRSVKGLHYPLVIAAAYSGFAVYGVGLSGSVPLLINTPGHFMESVIGLVPLSETIFSPYLITMNLILLVTLPLFNAMLHPKRAEDVIEAKPEPETVLTPTESAAPTLADRLNNSRILGVGMGLFGLLYVVLYLVNGGSVTLNFVNTLFLFLGITLFVTPNRFLAALQDGIKVVSGIIIQYPFYAGILAILSGSGLIVTLANWFVSISSGGTLPIFSFLSAGLINLFVPSGGGQWVIQGPVMMEAARQLHASVPATALAVQIGDQWTNMVQPFWLLPAMAISGLKLKDLMGYMVVITLYLGIVFLATVAIWGMVAA
ncbi:short-chain fatty acid transporter [Thioclava dalianensis]|uniref:Short-chain fatty acid transporter n=1 Tax=Thioclava dalianensis TaxID=1185766 RepID=A0A074TK60_9RHOB|nr:TIGR00366 family protein [Thioclava dalianensis]KEP70560.1 short-chain fatty acid transporter [Thioclava dalianensis]SFN07590.1 short-chain fatty acids transporter [Thioclava dalianensis]